MFYLKLASTGKKIGFSVSMKRHSFTYGTRQTVIYDNILTNDGNGYDDRTGVFTCPVAGTYMFVVDALCKEATYLALDHNKTPIAFLHRDSQYSKNPLVQISRTVLLKLTKGDHVKVSVGKHVFMNGYDYSGFTGYQNVFFSTQYLPTCINSESVSFCICMLLKYSLNNNSAIKSF